jgi:hypothetical protein
MVTPPTVIVINEDVSVSDDPAVTPPAVITVNETILVEDNGGPVSTAPIVDAGAGAIIGVGETATLAGSVIMFNPELAAAEIDWGDGTVDAVTPGPAGAISAVHIYSATGVFDVSVAVANPFGDEGTDTAQFEVVELPPQLDLGGPYSGDIDQPVILTADGFDDAGSSLAFEWDLDQDGIFEISGQTAIFVSSWPGQFDVSVRAEGPGGTTQAEAVVSIAVPPPDPSAPGSPAFTGPPITLQILNLDGLGPVGEGDRFRITAIPQNFLPIQTVEFFLDGVPLPPGTTLTADTVVPAGSAGQLLIIEA